MRRTKEEAEQTKEAIFQAGIRLLSEKGISETSMADIAREAGVTRGAIYWHFKDKEELIQEIHGRLHTFYRNLVDTIVATKASLAQGIGMALRILLKRYREDSEYRRMQELQFKLSILYAGNLSIAEEIAQHEQRARQRFCSFAAENGHVADLASSTLFLILESFVGGLLLRQFFRKSYMNETEIEAAVDFLVFGINQLVTIQGEETT